MSVCVLSRGEYVNVFAAAWCHGSIGSREGKQRLERFAGNANTVMGANIDTYDYSYNEHSAPEIPITAREIEMAIVRMTVITQQSAYRSFESIRYNLMANDGKDFATAQILDILLEVARGFLKRQMLRVGAA